jgi:hypothetical protein
MARTVKILAVAGLALAVVSCNILQQLEGGGSGGSSTGSSTTASATGGASTTGAGLDCGVDPQTSATLCLGNTLCPGLAIDSSVYPGCGFRVNGAAVDVECSCSGSLCPLGASTCAEAQQLLASESYGVVCAEISAGACVAGTPLSPSSSSSSCNTVCRDDCDGDPTCIEACGC